MVWACESGEHMPDKKRYVEEMVHKLKPGGTLVIATWCQRHEPPAPLTEEKSKLQFLYDEVGTSVLYLHQGLLLLGGKHRRDDPSAKR